MTPQDGAQVEGTLTQELSPLGDSHYALSRQKLNEIINMLRDCGTEGIIKLPKIAVIGNQSAGKSSLIEAISQIKLPRASGTCTRCPMEVILRRSTEKRAKVSLRFDQNDPRAKKSEPNHFAETEKLEDITLFLRRAQLAILNPGKNVEEFKYLDDAQCDKCDTAQKFSQSTVVLEITGADVDVTFIDLPGIISNTEKTEEGHLIDLIKDLAISYVSQEECLILVAISMKDDIDNQSAAKIAKEYDPNGLRTIGVLTKADTVQEGDYGQWLKILRNESHILRRGYYVTRLPGPNPKEMVQTWDEAREVERRYFGHKPWSEFKSRLGIPKLTEALSNALAQMIDERLPGLKKELKLNMREVQDELDGLPPSFSDHPQARLLDLCADFISEIDEYTNGSTNQPKFLQDIHDEFWKLANEILGTRLTFEINPKATTQGVIIPAAAPMLCVAPSPAATETVLRSDEKRKRAQLVISLSSVRDVIRQKSVRELPGIIPFTVHEHYIDMFTSKWVPICLDSFREIEDILKALVQRLCKQNFERFRTSDLLHEVDTVTADVLGKAATQTRDQIQLYCRMESRRPFTLNHTDYSASKEQNITDFAHHRNGNPSPLVPISSSKHTIRDIYGNSQSIRSDGDSDDTLLGLLTAKGYRISSTKQLARLHDPDEYEAELNVISEVLAYFDISSKRIIDVMPMIFETVFARNFQHDIRKVLTSKLALVGEFGLDNCARYVVDEPIVRMKREDLNERKATLSKALEILSRFFN